MKRRVIALTLALALLLPSAVFAVADAPEALDIDIEEEELALDEAGEELAVGGDEVTFEDEALILDGDLDVDLLSDELLDLQLEEDTLPGETDGAALGVQSDDAAAQTGGGETTDSVTVSGEADNDALFEAWMNQMLPGMKRLRLLRAARSGRATLDGINLKLYDALVPMIQEVANGKRTSTKLAVDDAAAGVADSWWTAEQLGLESLDSLDLTVKEDRQLLGGALFSKEGFNQKKILQALLVDCPYALYWFDKVTGGMGWSYGMSIKAGKARLSSLGANMAVAMDYSKTRETGTYEVNDLPKKVTDAVSKINTIVSDNASKDDLDKLRAYANAICGLVDYNSAAANDSTTPYGDPWQLVFIFDGDDSTKVVCEGYSKGLKYLCDLSSFNGDVSCELMSGSIPAGAHMWNSVQMPDGRSYLVDLTNSDGGGACNEKYFLKGCKSQTGSTFTCGTLTYTYNENTLATFSTAVRTMSTADYGKGYAVKTSVEHGTLTASPETADAGATVTLTVTPDAGFVAAEPVVKLGSQSLSLQQAGDGQWRFTMPYGDVSASAAITWVYSASGYSGVYDGKAHGVTVEALDATVSYGTASGTYNLSQSPTWKDVGTHTVYFRIQSGSDTLAQGEATVVITPKTVGLSWSNMAFTYDGNTHAPTATATGLASGDSCAVTVSGGQKNVGSHTARATGLSNGNYALPSSTTQAFTIGKKTVGLSWSNTAFTYDGGTHAPTATATGLASGDSCAVTVTGGQRNAGNYTATATGLSNGNYALPASATRAFTIAKKTVGLSWSNTAFTYDGNTHAPAATATGLASGDGCAVTVTGGQRNAGSHTARATGLSNGNYALPGSVTRAFTIAPRTAELVWQTGLTYNGEAQTPSVTVGNLASGDSCAVAVTGSGKDAGDYQATVTGLSNGNYALPGDLTWTFTIAPKTVGLKWTKTSLTYNGKTQKPKLALTGLVPGDTCTVTMKGSRKNAGNYTAKATRLSNPNYALPAVRSKVCTIKKKTVKLKWTKTKLKYTGKSQKPTATATGLIKGDKCTVTVSGAKKKKGTYTARATKLSNKNYQLPKKVTVKFKIY